MPGSRRPVADVVDVVDVGATNSRGVFTSAGYFDSLATPESLDVKRRYTARYGEHAPVLNSPGESCYEGMRLLSELLTRAGSVQVPGVCRAAADTRYESPRGEVRLRDAPSTRPSTSPRRTRSRRRCSTWACRGRSTGSS